MSDNPEYIGYDVGCKLVKYFPGRGWFEGTIEEIRLEAAQNKTRRIKYSDGDTEDLSIEEIQRARKSYARKLSQDRKKDIMDSSYSNEETDGRHVSPATAAVELDTNLTVPPLVPQCNDQNSGIAPGHVSHVPIPLPRYSTMEEVQDTVTKETMTTLRQDQVMTHSKRQRISSPALRRSARLKNTQSVSFTEEDDYVSEEEEQRHSIPEAFFSQNDASTSEDAARSTNTPSAQPSPVDSPTKVSIQIQNIKSILFDIETDPVLLRRYVKLGKQLLQSLFKTSDLSPIISKFMEEHSFDKDIQKKYADGKEYEIQFMDKNDVKSDYAPEIYMLCLKIGEEYVFVKAGVCLDGCRHGDYVQNENQKYIPFCKFEGASDDMESQMNRDFRSFFSDVLTYDNIAEDFRETCQSVLAGAMDLERKENLNHATDKLEECICGHTGAKTNADDLSSQRAGAVKAFGDVQAKMSSKKGSVAIFYVNSEATKGTNRKNLYEVATKDLGWQTALIIESEFDQHEKSKCRPITRLCVKNNSCIIFMNSSGTATNPKKWFSALFQRDVLFHVHIVNQALSRFSWDGESGIETKETAFMAANCIERMDLVHTGPFYQAFLSKMRFVRDMHGIDMLNGDYGKYLNPTLYFTTPSSDMRLEFYYKDTMVFRIHI